MSLITLKNLNMSYEGERVISDLNLEIHEGDYLCIVGENGTGKTTLLKGLLGLKKIDSGSIVTKEGFGLEKIGYLPQQTAIQKDFPASVKEVVLSGTISGSGFKPFYSGNDRKKAMEAMKKLEIEHIAKKSYQDLSGGQKQRVLLARAICASAKVLVLDEPVNGLDSIAADEMYEIIDKLNRDGITIIMISHDIKRVIKNSKHILHLGQQKTMFSGESSEYKLAAESGGFWERNI